VSVYRPKYTVKGEKKVSAIWWYKFTFAGQVIRESSKSNSKTVAKDAERARRREMELAINRIPKREKTPLFASAADLWLAGKSGLAETSKQRYKECVAVLKNEFGKRLVCDFDGNDIAEYQRKRLLEGLSGRTVNYEVGSLRGILRQFGLWGAIADRVHSLPERHDVGRALSVEDQAKLITAVGGSRSPALVPLFLLSLDTGMRAGEVRALRLRDLHLTWDKNQITSGDVIVPKSKTAAGTGRLIPLSKRVCASLTFWMGYFPKATPDSYLFAFYQVGIGGDSRAVTMYDVDLNRPMGSWRKGWLEACKRAGVSYRWHDLRHTFVTRLAERPDVSEQTVRALAGHVSNQMLQHYSHIRSQAKQAAIRTLEDQAGEPILPEHGQRIGQSSRDAQDETEANSLETNGGPGRIRTYDQRIMSPLL
jgi:integrase